MITNIFRCAYEATALKHLSIAQETNRWQRTGFISKAQRACILAAYPCSFFHPNAAIRVLLFIASTVALAGVTGILTLMFAASGSTAATLLCLVIATGLFTILETKLIAEKKHYKSGVTDGFLYTGIALSLAGIGNGCDFNMHAMMALTAIICGIASLRYLDAFLITISLLSIGSFTFYESYHAGGLPKTLVAFTLMTLFTLLFVLFRKIRSQAENTQKKRFRNVGEATCLFAVYVAGNYLCVRELSVGLLGVSLRPDEDIPFAIVFYLLTAGIPVGYLYLGVLKKDTTFLRVGLVTFGLSLYTWAHYRMGGQYELFCMVAGFILITTAILISRYLKNTRQGFTRSKILVEGQTHENLMAFAVAQTMEPATAPEDHPYQGSGGFFGGGGATGRF